VEKGFLRNMRPYIWENFFINTHIFRKFFPGERKRGVDILWMNSALNLKTLKFLRKGILKQSLRL
jgi:hypothetical protein